jgi:large subunit ribosomal protein L5e
MRRRLIQQDKNKYESKKYRFVVRRSNKFIKTQVIFATINGDRVLTEATSRELPRYGVEKGLTNYAAAYSTGLLCARRLLDKVGMADMYKGQQKIDGEDYDVNTDMGERRPFKCFLDIGLQRSTTGAKIYGALKGGVDGGLYIPHEHKRFPGYGETREEIQGKRGKVELEKATASWEPKVMRDHIFGNHIQNYMDELKKDSKDRYDRHFSKWDAAIKKSKAKNLEDLYTKCHAAIRKDPKHSKKENKGWKNTVQSTKEGEELRKNSKATWRTLRRLSLAQRKARVVAKITAAISS